MNCPYCNSQLSDKEIQCRICGNFLPESVKSSEKTTENTKDSKEEIIDLTNESPQKLPSLSQLNTQQISQLDTQKLNQIKDGDAENPFEGEDEHSLQWVALPIPPSESKNKAPTLVPWTRDVPLQTPSQGKGLPAVHKPKQGASPGKNAPKNDISEAKKPKTPLHKNTPRTAKNASGSPPALPAIQASSVSKPPPLPTKERKTTAKSKENKISAILQAPPPLSSQQAASPAPIAGLAKMQNPSSPNHNDLRKPKKERGEQSSISTPPLPNKEETQKLGSFLERRFLDKTSSKAQEDEGDWDYAVDGLLSSFSSSPQKRAQKPENNIAKPLPPSPLPSLNVNNDLLAKEKTESAKLSSGKEAEQGEKLRFDLSPLAPPPSSQNNIPIPKPSSPKLPKPSTKTQSKSHQENHSPQLAKNLTTLPKENLSSTLTKNLPTPTTEHQEEPVFDFKEQDFDALFGSITPHENQEPLPPFPKISSENLTNKTKTPEEEAIPALLEDSSPEGIFENQEEAVKEELLSENPQPKPPEIILPKLVSKSAEEIPQVQDDFLEEIEKNSEPGSDTEELNQNQLRSLLEPEKPPTSLPVPSGSEQTSFQPVLSVLDECNQALDKNYLETGAFEKLKQFLQEKEDWNTLVNEYHRMISRVPPGQNPALQASLWHELGLLYQDKIKDIPSGIKAVEYACRVEPSNTSYQKTLAQICAKDPDKVYEAIENYENLLSLGLERTSALASLFALYQQTNQHQKAYKIDSIIRLVDSSILDEELPTIQEDFFPLQFASNDLDDALWQRFFVKPEEKKPLSQVFALLVSFIAPFYAHSERSLGLHRKEFVNTKDDTYPMNRLFRYVTQTLQLAQPLLYFDGTRDNKIPQTGLLYEALIYEKQLRTAVVVSVDLLVHIQQKELVCLLAKHLVYMRPEYILIRVLKSDQLLLETLLYAIKKLVLPEVKLPKKYENQINKLAKKLHRKIPASVLLNVQEILGNTTPENLSITDWMCQAELIANRVALLLCGDLNVLSQFLRFDTTPLSMLPIKNKLNDLVNFILHPNYAFLQDALGFSE